MQLDNDLLDVHLHAGDVNTIGVQALVIEMQQQRNIMRDLLDVIHHVGAENQDATNFRSLKLGIDKIVMHAHAVDAHAEVHSLYWRDFIDG